METGRKFGLQKSQIAISIIVVVASIVIITISVVITLAN
jgi:hypothetical protein